MWEDLQVPAHLAFLLLLLLLLLLGILCVRLLFRTAIATAILITMLILMVQQPHICRWVLNHITLIKNVHMF